jgi:hypothetical protein
VTIEVRYVVTAAAGGRDYSMRFNSSAPGSIRGARTCRSSYDLETRVIEALRGI